MRVPAPSSVRRAIPSAVDDVVLKAVAWRPEERFGSAHDFAVALEAAARTHSDRSTSWLGSRSEVARHISRLLGAKLLARREMLLQDTPTDGLPVTASPRVDATPMASTSDSASAAPDSNARVSAEKRRPSRTTLRLALVPLFAFAVGLIITPVTKDRFGASTPPPIAESPITESARLQTLLVGTTANKNSVVACPSRDALPVPQAAALTVAPALPLAAPPAAGRNDAPPIRAIAPGPAPTPATTSKPAGTQSSGPDVAVLPRAARTPDSLLAAPPATAPENPYAE